VSLQSSVFCCFTDSSALPSLFFYYVHSVAIYSPYRVSLPAWSFSFYISRLLLITRCFLCFCRDSAFQERPVTDQNIPSRRSQQPPFDWFSGILPDILRLHNDCYYRRTYFVSNSRVCVGLCLLASHLHFFKLLARHFQLCSRPRANISLMTEELSHSFFSWRLYSTSQRLWLSKCSSPRLQSERSSCLQASSCRRAIINGWIDDAEASTLNYQEDLEY